MKIKLDENIGFRGTELFRQAGHDVATVAEENLCAATDKELLDVCSREKRCLVTLDLDFGNPIIFRPNRYSGIAVLRLPPRPSYGDLVDAILTVVHGLSRNEISGRLWIVQRGRVREYQSEERD